MPNSVFKISFVKNSPIDLAHQVSDENTLVGWAMGGRDELSPFAALSIPRQMANHILSNIAWFGTCMQDINRNVSTNMIIR